MSIIAGTVILLIIAGICLLVSKSAGITNENYNQQPYSDHDLRVSCFFDQPHGEDFHYCPPVSATRAASRRRKKERKLSSNMMPDRDPFQDIPGQFIIPGEQLYA